jgi:hypothetical protein
MYVPIPKVARKVDKSTSSAFTIDVVGRRGANAANRNDDTPGGRVPGVGMVRSQLLCDEHRHLLASSDAAVSFSFFFIYFFALPRAARASDILWCGKNKRRQRVRK